MFFSVYPEPPGSGSSLVLSIHGHFGLEAELFPNVSRAILRLDPVGPLPRNDA